MLFSRGILHRLKSKIEGSQMATNCSQLKTQSADGKFYKIERSNKSNAILFT
jgi:hypothetical protein